MTNTTITDAPALTVDLPPCPPWCAEHDEDGDHVRTLGGVAVDSELHAGETEVMPVLLVADERVSGRQVQLYPAQVWVGVLRMVPSQARHLAGMLIEAADLAEQETSG